MSIKKLNGRRLKLKTLMLWMGVTETQIARKFKCSVAFVSMYVKGTRKSKKLDKYFAKLRNDYEMSEERFRKQVEDDFKNK